MDNKKTNSNLADDIRNDLMDKSKSNMEKRLKSVTLVINISPSFFHIIALNNRKSQTFDYLYDRCKHSFNTVKNDMKKILHLIELPKSGLNSRSKVKLHLNIFNERCGCVNCLSTCHIFDVHHGADLRQIILNILKSEYFKNWQKDWLKLTMQQIFIFLCCIKNGFINEKLLESASVIAKSFISKPNLKILIEIQYGYQNFHINLMNLAKSNKMHSEFKGTGREELIVIDGIKIFAFKSVADMNEFTKLQIKHSKTKRIELTKTNDLTKIKGWKGKLFKTKKNSRNCYRMTSTQGFQGGNNENQEAITANENSGNQSRTISTQVFPRGSNENREARTANENSGNHSRTISTQAFPRRSNENREVRTANENSGNHIRTISKQAFPRGSIENREIRTANENSGNHSRTISTQAFSRGSNENQMSDAKPGKMYENPVLQGAKIAEENVNNNVFESEELDEFLKSNSRLNISFEIPKLRAAEVFTGKQQTDAISKSPVSALNSLILSDENGRNPKVAEISRDMNLKRVEANPGKRSISIQTDFIFERREIENDYLTKRCPRLIPKSLDDEPECKKKKLESPPENFHQKIIPIVHKCRLLDNVCTCKKFILGMKLNIGQGILLPNETVENLQLLSKDNVIDKRWATIASCALSERICEKRKSIVVPVVSKKILDSITILDGLILMVPNSSIAVDESVKCVVKDLVNYVERNLDISHDLPYDTVKTIPAKKGKKATFPKLIRELRKLVNVSVVNEREPVGLCGNDFCAKGCICSSLNNKLDADVHCGKADCMFECQCSNRLSNEDQSLAKEELAWQNHQTVVIGSKTRNSIEFKNKTQREPKLPAKLWNDILSGAEFDSVLFSPKRVGSTSVQKAEDNEKEKLNLNRRHVNKIRLEFCAGKLVGTRTLSDFFIWCTVHEKYNCVCASTVIRLNDNLLIWRSNRFRRYLSAKAMSKMVLPSYSSKQVHLYDCKLFSARTYGTSFDYAVRNRSEIFRTKRQCENDHDILSCTNSFIRIKAFMINERETVADDKLGGVKHDKVEVFRSLTNKNVYISKAEEEKEEEVDVEEIEGITPVSVDYMDTSSGRLEDEVNRDAPVCKDKSVPNVDHSTPVSVDAANITLENSEDLFDNVALNMKDSTSVSKDKIQVEDNSPASEDSEVVCCYEIVPHIVDEPILSPAVDESVPKMDDEDKVLAVEDSSTPASFFFVDIMAECSEEFRREGTKVPNMDERVCAEKVKEQVPIKEKRLLNIANSMNAESHININEEHDYAKNVHLLKVDLDNFDDIITIVDSDEEEHDDDTLPVTDDATNRDALIQTSKHLSSNDKPSLDLSNNSFKPSHDDQIVQEPSTLNTPKTIIPKLNITKENVKFIKIKNIPQGLKTLKRISKPLSKKYRTEKVDYELENYLIKLEEHPEQKNLFRDDKLPNLAFMCLTKGIGHLPLLEFKNDQPIVQDPINSSLYRAFKSKEAANIWLNRFFKKHLLFETNDTKLEWIVVKPGVLKVKNSKPFDVSILDKALMVTKNGGIKSLEKRMYTAKSQAEVPLTFDPKILEQVTLQKLKRTKETSINTDEEINAKKRKTQLGEDDNTVNSNTLPPTHYIALSKFLTGPNKEQFLLTKDTTITRTVSSSTMSSKNNVQNMSSKNSFPIIHIKLQKTIPK